jgi:hypothetical protein
MPREALSLQRSLKPVFPRCRGFQLTTCADSSIRIRNIEAIGWADHGGRDG